MKLRRYAVVHKNELRKEKKMEHITSRKNSTIAHVRKLIANRAYRRECGEMVCEGPKMLKEALGHGGELVSVMMVEGTSLDVTLPRGVQLYTMPEELLSFVADTKTPQKLLFVCKIPQLKPENELEKGNYLVLDGLQDPGNVGTIWRTADAFGARALYLLPGCADPWSPKTIRASMGACFRLPIWEVSLDALCESLKKEGIPLYATALREDAVSPEEVSLRHVAVVMGSEGKGISQVTLDACEKALKIPMRERCESLNAAVAASVILWEMAKNK